MKPANYTWRKCNWCTCSFAKGWMQNYPINSEKMNLLLWNTWFANLTTILSGKLIYESKIGSFLSARCPIYLDSIILIRTLTSWLIIQTYCFLTHMAWKIIPKGRWILHTLLGRHLPTEIWTSCRYNFFILAIKCIFQRCFSGTSMSKRTCSVRKRNLSFWSRNNNIQKTVIPNFERLHFQSIITVSVF